MCTTESRNIKENPMKQHEDFSALLIPIKSVQWFLQYLSREK